MINYYLCAQLGWGHLDWVYQPLRSLQVTLVNVLSLCYQMTMYDSASLSACCAFAASQTYLDLALLHHALALFHYVHYATVATAVNVH